MDLALSMMIGILLVSRIFRHISSPSIPGHHDIQEHQVDLLLFQDLQSVQGIVGLKYFISVADQVDLHQVRDLFSSSTTRILI